MFYVPIFFAIREMAYVSILCFCALLIFIDKDHEGTRVYAKYDLYKRSTYTRIYIYG